VGGAAQVIVTTPAFRVAEGVVGGDGIVAGVTGVDGGDWSDVPEAL